MGNPRLFYRDIIGQEDIVARLKAFTDFFAGTGGTPGHILLIGEDGMGKTSLVTAVCNERDVGFQDVDGASLEIQGDLTARLTNLKANQIFFIANIHRLRSSLSVKLKKAMREDRLDITIGDRTHVMDIHPFTLIASCPKKSDCPQELVNEFSLILTLQPYSKVELQTLAHRIACAAGLTLDVGASELIARSCDGRPEHLETILKRVARAINKTAISEEELLKAFMAFGINVRQNKSSIGIGDLRDLSGQDFEALISSLLTRMGFQTEMTKVTGDGGIDIIAVLDKPILGGKYVFQCKRFASDNFVGAPTVRDFYGAVTADRAVKGIFITTSGFTAQAREFGERVGIELIDLGALERLLLEYKLIELQGE